MNLTRKINYYIDDDGFYRRIPWDSWYTDGAFFGLSPISILNQEIIEFDSSGVLTLNTDFLDVADEGDFEKKDSDIVGLF